MHRTNLMKHSRGCTVGSVAHSANMSMFQCKRSANVLGLRKNSTMIQCYQYSISEGFGKWMETQEDRLRKDKQTVQYSTVRDDNKSSDSVCLILLANPKYEQSLQLQQFLFDHVRSLKSGNGTKQQNRQYLIATEHAESCFTIGKLRFDETFTKNHILNNPRQLPIHKIGRGGGITFHCRGQLVLYPIFDLENSSILQKNIKWFSDEFILRSLCVPFLQQFSNDLVHGLSSKLGAEGNVSFHAGGESEMGIYSERKQFWEGEDARKRKLASIGLQLSRFVSMHGVAMNLDLNEEDLQSFRSDIVACGLHHVTMTCLAKELQMDHFSQEQYLHMMNVLVAQLSNCHLHVDQIVYSDCQSHKTKFLSLRGEGISSELLNFIEMNLLKKGD